MEFITIISIDKIIKDVETHMKTETKLQPILPINTLHATTLFTKGSVMN